MKITRSLMLASLAGIAALAATAAFAQATSQGEVAKVDKQSGRITIKHDGVKNLDMPPMAMAFKVRDARLLDSVAPGDKVRFAAEKLDGSYTLTSLAKN